MRCQEDAHLFYSNNNEVSGGGAPWEKKHGRKTKFGEL